MTAPARTTRGSGERERSRILRARGATLIPGRVLAADSSGKTGDAAFTILAERPRRGVVVSREAHLTRRELEILALVAEGMTNAEIGARLWISSGTVRRHLENAFSKLEVHTRTGAVRAAFG